MNIVKQIFNTRVTTALSGLFFVFVFSASVSALIPAQKKVFQQGIGYFNVVDDATCNAGGASSVFFPSGMDTLTIEQKIATYITNTVPGSPLIAFSFSPRTTSTPLLSFSCLAILQYRASWNLSFGVLRKT